MDQNIQSLITCETGAKKTTKTSRIRRKKHKNKPNNSCLPLILSTHIKKSKPFTHWQKSRNHSQRLAQWENHITGSAGNRQKGCHRSVFHWWSAPFCIFRVVVSSNAFGIFTPKSGEDVPHFDMQILSKGLVQPPTRFLGLDLWSCSCSWMHGHCQVRPQQDFGRNWAERHVAGLSSGHVFPNLLWRNGFSA